MARNAQGLAQLRPSKGRIHAVYRLDQPASLRGSSNVINTPPSPMLLSLPEPNAAGLCRPNISHDQASGTWFQCPFLLLGPGPGAHDQSQQRPA